MPDPTQTAIQQRLGGMQPPQMQSMPQMNPQAMKTAQWQDALMQIANTLGPMNIQPQFTQNVMQNWAVEKGNIQNLNRGMLDQWNAQLELKKAQLDEELGIAKFAQSQVESEARIGIAKAGEKRAQEKHKPELLEMDLRQALLEEQTELTKVTILKEELDYTKAAALMIPDIENSLEELKFKKIERKQAKQKGQADIDFAQLKVQQLEENLILARRFEDTGTQQGALIAANIRNSLNAASAIPKTEVISSDYLINRAAARNPEIAAMVEAGSTYLNDPNNFARFVEKVRIYNDDNLLALAPIIDSITDKAITLKQTDGIDLQKGTLSGDSADELIRHVISQFGPIYNEIVANPELLKILRQEILPDVIDDVDYSIGKEALPSGIAGEIAGGSIIYEKLLRGKKPITVQWLEKEIKKLQETYLTIQGKLKTSVPKWD